MLPEPPGAINDFVNVPPGKPISGPDDVRSCGSRRLRCLAATYRLHEIDRYQQTPPNRQSWYSRSNLSCSRRINGSWDSGFPETRSTRSVGV